MFVTGGDPSNIISEKNLSQIDDDSVLQKAIMEVISEFPTQVAEYKNGKTAVLQFLIGKVMAKTRGQANPEKVQELLQKKFM